MKNFDDIIELIGEGIVIAESQDFHFLILLEVRKTNYCEILDINSYQICEKNLSQKEIVYQSKPYSFKQKEDSGFITVKISEEVEKALLSFNSLARLLFKETKSPYLEHHIKSTEEILYKEIKKLKNKEEKIIKEYITRKRLENLF